MIKVKSPESLADIINSMESVHRESTTFWNGFSNAEFFAPIGEAWSPAENVRHLTKSTKPLITAFTLPAIILKLSFGSPKKPSRSYDELKQTYLSTLAGGAKAGRFTPSPEHETNQDKWRERIMTERENTMKKFIGKVSKWQNGALDQYYLPHPLLGKLTVREMLFFTVYHHQHHVEVVERRRAELKR